MSKFLQQMTAPYDDAALTTAASGMRGFITANGFLPVVMTEWSIYPGMRVTGRPLINGVLGKAVTVLLGDISFGGHMVPGHDLGLWFLDPPPVLAYLAGWPKRESQMSKREILANALYTTHLDSAGVSADARLAAVDLVCDGGSLEELTLLTAGWPLPVQAVYEAIQIPHFVRQLGGAFNERR